MYVLCDSPHSCYIYKRECLYTCLFARYKKPNNYTDSNLRSSLHFVHLKVDENAAS